MGKYTIPSNIQDYALHPAVLKDNKTARSSLEIMKGLITGARASARAQAAEITTNSLLTAQLRWEDWDDMDLHITEPNGTSVFYRNKYGNHGYLDLDDTDGHGPEHYFIREQLDCNALSNKQWNFSAHQYPNGGNKAVAHFMLKVGDNRVMSRSFGINQWSSAPLNIGKVTFNPYTKGSSTLSYTMEIVDPVGTN